MRYNNALAILSLVINAIAVACMLHSIANNNCTMLITAAICYTFSVYLAYYNIVRL